MDVEGRRDELQNRVFKDSHLLLYASFLLRLLHISLLSYICEFNSRCFYIHLIERTQIKYNTNMINYLICRKYVYIHIHSWAIHRMNNYTNHLCGMDVEGRRGEKKRITT